MPAGRAAAFGAAATVVGAYALQDHLRSRAAVQGDWRSAKAPRRGFGAR